MTSLTRGPLPASVYWRRRVVVLGLGLVLLLVGGKLFGGDGDGDKDKAVDRATQISGEPTGSVPTDPSTTGPKQPKKPKTPQEPVLAQPDGPCEDSDIVITPTVAEAVAGRPVAVTLELRTATAEACTWRVSAGHVTIKITSGTDEIWSSRQCPGAVPVQDVVVRSAVTTFVDVPWKARRSDDGCPVQTQWALPGTYHVAAAALGGEPAEARFELERPSAEVITPPQNPTKPKQRQPVDPEAGAGNHEDQPNVR
ncbi:MAG TPA: hypothetical protein VNQ53_05790 [Nocardioides sp.]|nr:hypothetical protein [Nocardioides sp.]